uniref:Uncharacterized protein n=1 Tax=Avena sativa TaxID=4498 RepID=A0ACD5WWL4_AVESA
MLRKSSSQKTLRDVMQEERTGSSMGMASRLLAPDASLSNPSFRNYYGVAAAGSVPFLWESAPGTPKNGILSTELPPLTPPPSYYSKTSKSKSSKKLLPSPKPAASFVSKIFRRSYTMPSPSSTKESIQAQCSRRRWLVDDSPRSSFSSTSRVDDEEGDDEVRSTLCFFGTRHSGGGTGRLHGPLASVVRG